jgi:ribonuclease P protein component
MVAGERVDGAGRGPEGFPASHRLRRRPEIRHVYDMGRKVPGRLAVVFSRPSAGPSTRLGVTVTRKAGSAVIRNLLRRRVREIFRRSAAVGAATPFDVVVNVSPQGAEAPFAELRDELERLLARALGRPA